MARSGRQPRRPLPRKDSHFRHFGGLQKKEKKNKNSTTLQILLTIHVDDAIVATNDDDVYQRFLQELGTEFELSANGKLTWFLGCKVEQDLMRGTVRLRQEKYCNDVLTQFQMADANVVHTPCTRRANPTNICKRLIVRH
jgi:hypothetical protein